MIYKEYGKTGKKISALGFGGMRFRKEEYDRDPEICAEIVRYANEKGVNYFDTAPSYCDDMSETIFGLAFRSMPSPFYVSTKTSIQMDPAADDVRRRCELSLKRMNVSKIHFYHMWCILNLRQYERVMAPGGPYEGALRLKEEGLIDHICLSTHASGPEIRKIVETGGFDGILLGYNATNFAFRQEGLQAAFQKGMGVVTMNPLGGGTIPRNPQFYSYLTEGTSDTIAQAALRFNISHKEITTALSGMSTKAEVDENVAAAQDLSEATLKKSEAWKSRLNESFNTLCTGCGYCDSCPSGVPIPKMMDAYNMKILFNSPKEITSRLKNHWCVKKKLADQCTECGQCEGLCTQHLPIIERLKEIQSLPN